MECESAILIVGGDGKVGGTLAAHLAKAGTPVLSTTRRPMILSPLPGTPGRGAGGEGIDELANAQPLTPDPSPRSTGERGELYLDLACPDIWMPPEGIKTAILCAAMANIESCRTHPQDAWQVNVAGLLHVARKLHERGTSLVFLSTNAVFDGVKPHRRTDEATCPITEYGRQKAEAERLLRELDPHVTIVRFAKILDSCVPLFAQWKRSLLAGQIIEPFADMSMAPIPMSCAVSVLRLIMDRGAGGIYHVSGERDISYAQMGFWAAELLGADRKLVRPVSAAATGRVKDPIPKHTTLAVERLATEFGIEPPPAAWSIQQALLDA